MHHQTVVLYNEKVSITYFHPEKNYITAILLLTFANVVKYNSAFDNFSPKNANIFMSLGTD